MLGAAACVFWSCQDNTVELRRPTLIITWIIVKSSLFYLAPGMTFDQKPKFESQFWPLHIKEKQGKGNIFAMSKATLAVGRNQARP